MYVYIAQALAEFSSFFGGEYRVRSLSSGAGKRNRVISDDSRSVSEESDQRK